MQVGSGHPLPAADHTGRGSLECRIGGSNTHDVTIFVSGFLTISFELFNTDDSFEVACFVDVMMNAEGHGLPWADGHCAGCLQHKRSVLYFYSQHDESGKRGAWVPTPYGNMSLMPWGVKEATASLFVVSHACPSVVHVMSVLVNISGKAG